MDYNEREKDIPNLKFDKDSSLNDYKYLVQKLKSIKESIYFLERIVLKKEI